MDLLGKLLLRQGLLDGDLLEDVLEQQKRVFPLASLCYVLGHLDEETLVRALSKQWGVPGVVLDQSVIKLRCLQSVPRDLALRHNVLPVFEDERRVFVAVETPDARSEVLRELEFVKGKTVVPHVALHVTLARTLRACFAAADHGDESYAGYYADPGSAGALGAMAVVSDAADAAPESTPEALAQEAVIEDVTKELVDSDIILMDELDETLSTTSIDTQDPSRIAEPSRNEDVTEGSSAVERDSQPSLSVEMEPSMSSRVIDLDEGDGRGYESGHEGPPRILLVDDDFASRNLLVKQLQPGGYVTQTASTGGDAVRMIQQDPPDLVVVDVMLPEVDGFQICRAIKQSRRYGDIPVILMSAVIDSGRVTDEVLRRYGADAYFEKPLNVERVKRRIKDLVGTRRAPSHAAAEDDNFDRAMELYREGRVDGAVELLKAGLEVDPLSAKHHFVLANLLQKKSMIYEAIDEYEATVDLKPDYFPALTRLAYLYYKKGFSARAIETWRRSLPYCPDEKLRRNIEVFMRKLIADMQTEL